MSEPYEKQKKHLAKRKREGWRQVKIDLEPELVAMLDDVRGEASGTAFMKAAALEHIQHLKHKDTNDG